MMEKGHQFERKQPESLCDDAVVSDWDVQKKKMYCRAREANKGDPCCFLCSRLLRNHFCYDTIEARAASLICPPSKLVSSTTCF